MVAPRPGGALYQRDADGFQFTATVDDKTDQFFDQFDKRVDAMQAKTSTGLGGLGGVAAKAGAAFGIVGAAAGYATNKIVSSIDSAIDSMQNFIQGSIQMAARADTLAVSLKVVGGNLGYSKEEMDGYEKSLQKTGISILESRQALLLMAQANLDLSQSSKLARVAQDAAIPANLNSSEAFNRIVVSISTMNTEMLRNMGIQIDMRYTMETYAKSIGKVWQNLTVQERQQALVNAIMEKGKTLTGLYEASMLTAGKKAGSLTRFIQDLQVVLGEIFQEGYANKIDGITEKIKIVSKWIVDNTEDLKKLGGVAADTTKILIDLSTELLKLAVKLDISKNIVPTLQVISMVAGGIAAIIKMLEIYVDRLKDTISAVDDLLHGRTEEALQHIADMQAKAATAMDDVYKATQDAFWATGQYLGVIEDVTTATEAEAAAFNKAAIEAAKLAAAMQEGTNQLSDFLNKIQQDITERAIQANREYIEEQLKTSWAIEDAAREHAEAVLDILEKGQEAQKEAAKNFAEQKIDIEKNYQRTLEDLRTNFERNAHELARARDAIGLLRLMRTNKEQLEDAKKTKDRQTVDAKDAYQKQMVDLKKSQADQLKALEDSEQKKLEEAERSNERQEQLQTLHEQWAEEDRQRAYAQQLANLLTNIMSIEGMTDESLKALLKQYEGYFGNLIPMAQNYMNQVNAIMVPYGSILQTPSGAPYNPTLGGITPVTLPPMPTVIGQAGQVSGLLANTSMFRDVLKPRVPAVTPRLSTDKRDINVRVDGTALEPFIQRQVAMALIEVERNR